jgi:hypothetical protein
MIDKLISTTKGEKKQNVIFMFMGPCIVIIF